VRLRRKVILLQRFNFRRGYHGVGQILRLAQPQFGKPAAVQVCKT
jgi:hypothetical protein